MYPKITLRGISVVATAVTLFVIGGYTRVGWLFMFDAVLWGAIVVSAIMPVVVAGRLEVRRKVKSWDKADTLLGPTVGEQVVVEVEVTNRGWLPAMFLVVDYDREKRVPIDTKDRMFVAWLGRKSSQKGDATLVFNRRGTQILPPLKIETKVPFGLFRRTVFVGDPLELIVLPRILEFSGLDLKGREGDTNPAPFSARSGEQISGSRTLAPGDPWQSIHWRNTARTSQPQIKEYETSPDQSVVVGFDISKSHLVNEDALEEAIDLAASLADHICRESNTVHLVTDEVSMQTSDRLELLIELAISQGSKNSVLTTLPENISASSDIFAVVLDTDYSGIETLTKLAQSQYPVTVVVMRGFNENNLPTYPTESLNEAGVVVVECWPGEVQTALNSLKRVTDRVRVEPENRSVPVRG